MAQDPEVVAGELVASSEIIRIPLSKEKVLFQRLQRVLDQMTGEGEKEDYLSKVLSFQPKPDISSGQVVISGRIHFIWENVDEDEIVEAMVRMRELGLL